MSGWCQAFSAWRATLFTKRTATGKSLNSNVRWMVFPRLAHLGTRPMAVRICVAVSFGMDRFSQEQTVWSREKLERRSATAAVKLHCVCDAGSLLLSRCEPRSSMAARRKRPNNLVGGRVSAARLWAARLLIGVALGVSGYLAYVSLTQSTVAGCGPESGCGTVLQSRWGRWFGLPVSLLAVGVDTAILGASFRLGPGVSPALQRRAWGWITPLAILVAGA